MTQTKDWIYVEQAKEIFRLETNLEFCLKLGFK